MSVLGAILLENESLLDISINSSVFYRAAHKSIFEAMQYLLDDNEPIDLVTLTQKLKQLDKLEEVGGSSYLSTLVDYVPTSANIKYYAKIVQDKADQRHTIITASEIMDAAYSDNAEAMEIVNNKLTAFTEVELQTTIMARQAAPEAIKVYEQRYDSDTKLSGFSWGYDKLDNMTGGGCGGDLIIIAGQPSMGKTAFALNLIKNAEQHTYFSSLETTRQKIVDRFMTNYSRVSLHRIKTGTFHQADFPPLVNAAGEFAQLPLMIDDKGGITIGEYKSRLRRYKMKNPDFKLAVVDYLQLIRVPDAKDEFSAVTTVSKELLSLGKELDIAMVALSQLRRYEGTRRPTMSDLRQSGQIEQDASIIMFPWREAAVCEDCKKMKSGEGGDCGQGHERTADLIIAKQKDGPIGSIPMTFYGGIQRFEM